MTVSHNPRSTVLAFARRENVNNADNRIWGHPYMTSAMRGGGGLALKEDVVREVA